MQPRRPVLVDIARIPAPIAVVDADAICLDANEAFLEDFTMGEDVAGHPVDLVWHFCDVAAPARLRDAIRRAADGGSEVHELEFHATDVVGETEIVLLIAVLPELPGTAVVHVRDVTWIRQLERSAAGVRELARGELRAYAGLRARTVAWAPSPN